MDIKSILFAVLRKWWLIVLLAFIGAGAGYLSASAEKPIYQADTTLYIMNRSKVLDPNVQLNIQDITVPQQVVQVYSGIITSRLVTSSVAEDLAKKGLYLHENQILSMVSIYSQKDSNILTITAKSSSPTISADVANATADAFIQKMRQLTNTDNIGVLDRALVPDYPTEDYKIIKISLGFLIGIVFGFGIIYLILYFDNKVRSAEEIERELNIRVIGLIPEHDIR
ncbi:Wzz/FepE/Etk N-terminal domain-containing protein [Dehalobacter sp. CF]|jgi:Capsular polysaccharide biosynthesis protein|uniref:YveK family protein n=1 Tax=Dehalobacter sp. CF TaxID=1131462 RepID=UPI00028B924E|nr:Wzz/FepE/Etk N-terminal domain-containing protein [Dehalobacter sp. CF]AFV05128.1 lipopolysaccharide biosynthesis [Dehalobacter sp. CF]